MTSSDTRKTATDTTTDATTNTGQVPEVYAMTNMLRYAATAEDARFPLREIFFDPEAGALRYLALDVGGWFDSREVIVSARLMGAPDEASRTWPVDISPDAVKDAPEWSDPKVLEQMQLASSPPIIVGPYGAHFAGALPLERNEAENASDAPGNLKVEGFERLNDWVGLPVYGQNGEVGTLIDLLFDPETGKFAHLVIDTGGFFSAQQMVVPFDLLRHRAEDGTHVVIEVTEKTLRDAPPLEHFDKVSRSWLDTLRAYYQLTPRI